MTERVRFRGWWKGIPFVLIPFAAIFTEAWMRTEVLGKHYELSDLNGAVRESRERIQALRAQESHLRRISRIDSVAPDLGLVVPAPGQVVLIEAAHGGDQPARNEPSLVWGE